MKMIGKELFQSWIHTLQSLPKLTWILMICVFVLGMIIRRGGGKATSEMTAAAYVHGEEKVEWWTCSMHPQIKLPEPGKCPICFMDLIPMETENSGDVPTELKMSPAAVKLAEITTVPVKRSAAEKTIRLSGKVSVDETRVGKITAWVPGRLEKLFVDYTGTTVKKGSPMVELYSPELYAAQEELLQAKYQVERSESPLGRESAQITLEAVREKLRQLGLTDAQVNAIEIRGAASDRININSPMSGVVIHKNALEGLYVDRGTQIYTIADLSTIWVVLDAYESDVTWIREGQKVSFTVEAVPGETFEGKVVFVDPLLNEKTRTVTVRLNADNREGLLKPGMFVRAEVHTDVPAGADNRFPLQVPVTAVLKTGKKAMVYVRKPGAEQPVFEGREITVGTRVGDYYIVVAGLQEGEEVVVKGNFKIDSAFQIAAKPSMMNPSGGVTSTGHEHHGHGMMPSETEKPVQMKKETESKENEMDMTVAPEFINKLNPIYDHYFQAHAALADDDFKKAQHAFSELDATIMTLKTNQLKSHVGHVWSDLKNEIHEIAQHAHHWTDIASARKAFESVSSSILKMEKTFGHSGNNTYYEVFCPMAFDNKGAFWMQDHDTVDNPYFGSAMLRCGEIKSQFDSKKQ